MPTYIDIDYTLQRSRRKTASIYIERDGRISVRVPHELSPEQIERLLEQKRYWIYKHLAEWRELNAAQMDRQFVNGEGFLYLGRTYRLQWVDEQRAPLLLKDGYFTLRRDPKTLADPAEAFKSFYREKGRQRIGDRVQRYAPKVGVQVNEIRLMELQYRWASCSPNGNLNFHWRCMLAPLNVIDYIVVHELAHLRVPDHSPAFWHEVDKVLPDYRERQQWLRIHGAGMDL